MWKEKKIKVALFVFFLMFLAGFLSAQAETPEEFYQNNIPTMIANGGVGGGTDFASRIFASYWGEVTGAKPMMAKVMSGGGGIEGLNYVYYAKPDGLTMGVTHHPSDITAPILLKLPGPKWDPRKLSWIGLFGQSPQMLVIKKGSPYKTYDDLKKANKKLIFGAGSLGNSGSLGGSIAIAILGLDAKIVHGYESPELGLAARRGEVDMFSEEAALTSENMEKGLVEPFCSLTFERTKWFPNVPAIAEMVQLTPEQKDMLIVMKALQGCKSMFGPPGMDAARLAYVRSVFDKVMEHKGFLKQMKSRWLVWETPVPGGEVDKEVKEALSLPPEKAEAVRSLFQKYIK